MLNVFHVKNVPVKHSLLQLVLMLLSSTWRPAYNGKWCHFASVSTAVSCDKLNKRRKQHRNRGCLSGHFTKVACRLIKVNGFQKCNTCYESKKETLSQVRERERERERKDNLMLPCNLKMPCDLSKRLNKQLYV